MSDVKLLEPQRLTDNPNGGGLSTGVEIVDGQVNNLFDDISRVDRVNGDVSLRKGFVQATTANTDLYSGLHVIVAEPPADENVSVVLLKTPGWADEREQAKNVVERYLDPGVVTRMIPYDRQLAGQRTVLVFQRVEAGIPDIGEVFALEDGVTGFTQVFRITAVTSIADLFTDTIGDFNVRVLTLTISQPLEQDFQGSEPNRYFRPDAGRAVIRRTLVSDAARFKGITPLAEDAALGDVSIKVDAVFAQIVPAATTEIPIVDTPPAGSTALIRATHRADAETSTKRSVNVFDPFFNGGRFYWGTAMAPGSVVINFGNHPAAGTYQDAGDGTFIGVPSSLGLTIDYDTGVINCSNPGGTRPVPVTVSAHPAAAVAKSAFSRNIPILEASRGYVYVAALRPIPAPGSTVVSFRAAGRWYELRDAGDGVLRGDPGVGSGSINFATGTVSVTLGALPDVGSSVIIAYGPAGEYRTLTQDFTSLRAEIRFTVPEGNIEPGSFAFARHITDTSNLVVDDGEGGFDDGFGGIYATGWINYGTGEVCIKTVSLPTTGVLSRATYTAGANQEETFNPSKSGSTITLELENIPVASGSVSVMYQQEVSLEYPGPIGLVQTLRDNGAGQLIDATGAVIAGSSVNYTTGVITFNPDFTISAPSYNYATINQPIPGREADSSTGYFMSQEAFYRYYDNLTEDDFAISFVNGTAVIVRYREDSDSPTSGTYDFQVTTVRVDLSPNSPLPFVPGSLLLMTDSGSTFDTYTYIDRAGTLYRNHSGANNSGTIAGSIDYANGVALLTQWPTTFLFARLVGGLVQLGQLPIPMLTGRVPGSPLRPGSFGLRANRFSDGVEISAQADLSGNLDTGGIHGYVDVATGVFQVAFGQYLLDSSLTPEEKAEPWYDPALVTGDGYIWRTDPIIPGTIFFNAVVQSATPLDPQIIGINPVRLPLDGRAQVIRAGDTLVIHETLAETLPSPLSAAQVVALPRGNLAAVALYDQNGLGVPAEKFTVNLVAGEVTMADPLSLAGFVEPLVALHSVEDMALCTDAEITGQLKLAQSLSRGYNAATTYVSSALILGDVQARVEGLFAQQTWTAVWSDQVIGTPPTTGAQYNELTYPLVVLNRDAITQRWALVFTSSTAGNIVAEELGVIGEFSTSVDLAPVNPATGQPYFEMAAAGFGSGWSVGNVIRFNTVAAGGPIWVARTVRAGTATGTDDRARLQLRWDKD
jgi:hypothetical protein